jgi:hypothetical protein
MLPLPAGFARCSGIDRGSGNGHAPQCVAGRPDTQGFLPVIHPAVSLAKIAPLDGADRFYPASMAGCAGIELGVGRPAVGAQQGRGTPERVAKCHQAENRKAGDRVTHARDVDDASKQHRCEPPSPATEPGRLALQLRLCHDDVGSTLDPADQIRNEVGSMSKIGMHQDGAIPLGPVRSLHRFPQQPLDASRIASPLLVSDHAERQHPCVPLQHLSGRVSGAVIQNQQLVLALESCEDLANLPEKEPDRRGFVVTGNTDVNHEPSREWTHERYTDRTSSAMR